MAIEVVMPRLGWQMEVGSLVEWVKRDGDQVRPGDVVCTVQSDKAINEIESLDSGILRIPPSSPPPGEEVAVGTIMAYLVQPGEPAPFAASKAMVDDGEDLTPWRPLRRGGEGGRRIPKRQYRELVRLPDSWSRILLWRRIVLPR